MRNPGFLWIMIGLMAILDLYIFQAVKFIAPSSPKLRMGIFIVYWVFAAISLGILILLPYINYENWPRTVRTYVFAIVIGLFFSKLIASIFFVVDDIRRGCMWIIGKLFSNPSVAITEASEGITRSTFLSWLGIALGGGLFTTLLYGFRNKYQYDVKKIELAYENLPTAFKGLKIIHISDIHSGSFTDKKSVQKGIDKIMEQKPDLILFTGDLVNDRSSEMQDYMDVFSQLKAPLGVYSTLGNHDYGDYVRWDSEEAKKANLDNLKKVHSNLGWRLLMNEHVSVERNGSSIAILGIENWSAKGRFPKYGKMADAYTGTDKYP